MPEMSHANTRKIALCVTRGTIQHAALDADSAPPTGLGRITTRVVVPVEEVSQPGTPAQRTGTRIASMSVKAGKIRVLELPGFFLHISESLASS